MSYGVLRTAGIVLFIGWAVFLRLGVCPAAEGGPAAFTVGIVQVAAQSAQAPFYTIAEKAGLFRKHNVKVNVVYIPSGVAITQGVVAGELDAGVSSSHIFGAVAKGASVKMVGSLLPVLTFALYARPEIKTPAELRGRTIAAGAPFAALHVTALAMLRKHGLAPTDVNYVNIGSSVDAWRALVAGKVDAAMSILDFLDAASQHNRAVLLKSWEELPNYLMQFILVGDKTVQTRREELVRLLMALAEGVRYTYRNPEQAAQYAHEVTGRPLPEVRRVLETYYQAKVFSPNLALSRESILFTQALQKELKLQDEVLPVERVAALDVLQEAIRRIGEFRF
jgi:NitT/TauT family transport system substrate-binding protein